MNATRGERNNNPGNIEHTAAFRWRGELAPDPAMEPRFARFDTARNGIRALARNLLTYYRKHRLATVMDIIYRWAPPGENNAGAYVQHVANQMGVRLQDPLDLEDPLTLRKLVTAIIVHENGRCIYDDELIAAAVSDALEAQTEVPSPPLDSAATPSEPRVEAKPDREIFTLRGLRELLAGRSRAPDPSPVPLMSEAPMPVPALLAALLPSLIAAAPDLIKVFGDKSRPVSERNQEAAVRVLEIAKTVTGAPNEQAAVEAIEREPEKAAAFRNEIRASWFDLYDPEAFAAAEKSRREARAFAVQMTDGPMWRAVGFGAILFVLAMVTVLGAGWMLRETLLHDGTDQQTRGMIVGALVTWVGIVLAYFFGSSASSRNKDQALTEAARRP